MASHDWISPARVLVSGLAMALLTAIPSASAAPPSPTTPAATTVDEVRLTNGGFIKGEVLELMPGEYVVIKTLTGETRRFKWSEVASVERGGTTTTAPVVDTPPVVADPVIEPEPQPEPKPEPEPESDVEGPKPETPYVHIDVDGGHSMTLQRVTHRAVVVGSGGSASGVSFARVCTSPCDRLVENDGDEYFLTGDKYAGSRAFTLTGNSSVYELKVKPRPKGMLIGGYIMASMSPVFAGLLIAAPFLVNMKRSQANAAWALGGLGGALMLGGGITLMVFGRTKVEILPRNRSWLESH